ncbi:MAG: HAD family hydrolase [Melioribacteraceae bacterium]|nr:HAD family hydrolase [Melioribacteraceae bacterium]
MANKAIFLDRDGTINIDTGYIGNPNLIELYSGVVEGIKLLKDKYGFLIVVISNQSGITRGLITHEDVDKVNKRINEILESGNTKIDAFYYCPYHPEFDSKEKCNCRKPSPKLVFDAAEELDVELKKSFFIGDKISDSECGINAGMCSILVTNTISDAELNVLKNSQNSPNFISSNFLDAVKYIGNICNGEVFEN